MAEPNDTRDNPWNCTAQMNRDGRFCDRPAMPDAPFPICYRHAGRVLEFLRNALGERLVAIGDERVDFWLNYAGGLHTLAAAASVIAPESSKPPRTVRSLVYYIRVGEYIKIGRTINLPARLMSYPPDSELLATEPGGEEAEADRLRQFEHALTARKEWFAPTRDLLAHIDSLRNTA